MRKTALFLLILFSYGRLRAQEISGFAKDYQGKPLAGASVSLKKSKDSSIVKLGIPDAVLFKPGPLDENEVEIIRTHPAIACGRPATCSAVRATPRR